MSLRPAATSFDLPRVRGGAGVVSRESPRCGGAGGGGRWAGFWPTEPTDSRFLPRESEDLNHVMERLRANGGVGRLLFLGSSSSTRIRPPSLITWRKSLLQHRALEPPRLVCGSQDRGESNSAGPCASSTALMRSA